MLVLDRESGTPAKGKLSRYPSSRDRLRKLYQPLPDPLRTANLPKYELAAVAHPAQTQDCAKKERSPV